MVRRYEPYISHGNCYSDWDDPDAEMMESESGQWVKLKTFNDEIARLTAEVNRQKAKAKRFQQSLEEATGNFKDGNVFKIEYDFTTHTYIAYDAYTNISIVTSKDKQKLIDFCEQMGYILLEPKRWKR